MTDKNIYRQFLFLTHSPLDLPTIQRYSTACKSNKTTILAFVLQVFNCQHRTFTMFYTPVSVNICKTGCIIM